MGLFIFWTFDAVLLYEAWASLLKLTEGYYILFSGCAIRLFPLHLATKRYSASPFSLFALAEDVGFKGSMGRDPTEALSAPVPVANRLITGAAELPLFFQWRILVTCVRKSRDLLLWTGGEEMTSLSILLTVKSSLGYDDHHFPAAKLQAFGDGVEGHSNEHNVKVSYPVQVIRGCN